MEVTRRELRVATAAAEEGEAAAARARADLAAETTEGKEREAGTWPSCVHPRHLPSQFSRVPQMAVNASRI